MDALSLKQPQNSALRLLRKNLQAPDSFNQLLHFFFGSSPAGGKPYDRMAVVIFSPDLLREIRLKSFHLPFV